MTLVAQVHIKAKENSLEIRKAKTKKSVWDPVHFDLKELTWACDISSNSWAKLFKVPFSNWRPSSTPRVSTWACKSSFCSSKTKTKPNFFRF